MAHATTRHRERRTDLIHTGVAGTAIAGVAGMMTDGVEAGVIIVDAAITMDDATTADPRAEKGGASSAAFLCLQ